MKKINYCESAPWGCNEADFLVASWQALRMIERDGHVTSMSKVKHKWWWNVKIGGFPGVGIGDTYHRHPGKIPLEVFTKKQQTSHICVSLERSAGRKFLLPWEGLNLIHVVLSVVYWGMLLGVETTKFRMPLPIMFSCHETLSLKKVSLTGHQQVWGRTYQSLKQTQRQSTHW